MTEHALAGLNGPQIDAVKTVNGPVLVLAGPGSGKTRVLTRRIAWMIDAAGIAPWNILAVTFTNKAAREMLERVEAIFEDKFGKPQPGQPPRLGGLTIGTFHSVCARILRVETTAIGYARDWVIYDTGDQQALIREVIREQNLDEKRHSPAATLARISKWKNALLSPEDVQAEDFFEQNTARVYVRYQEALRAANAMDFDDLLMRPVALFRAREDLLRKYQQKWQYLLVDEFQDTNSAQYELTRLLVGPPDGNRNLFAVGDEDQSIYRFRGADYRNVRQFRQDFPEAHVVLLEQNYRSTQTILDVANAVIEKNQKRTRKRLFTENGQGLAVTVQEAYNESEEAAWVCDEIERLVATRAYSTGDFAVMYRTNAQSRALEEAFVRRRLKYRLVGATRFYERKEVKDALAYLRLVHNPADTVALDRIINTPARGIGSKSWSDFKSWASSAQVGGLPALQALLASAAAPGAPGMSARTVPAHPFNRRQLTAFAAFTRMVEHWRALVDAESVRSVADLLDRIMADSGYVDELRDGTDEGEERFENLQELRGVAAQFTLGMASSRPEMTPLGIFLEETALVSDADQVDERAGSVTLLTLHMAKGLEFPVVFMVGLENGILPHARSIESGDEEDMAEERRLAYVGITRAKRRLYLLHAMRRSLWGSQEMQTPSAFLDDIPEELLDGMVDKRARRESSFKRATAWEDESAWERPTTRNPYTGTPQGAGKSHVQTGKSQAQTGNSQAQTGKSQAQTGKSQVWSPAPRSVPAREAKSGAQPGGASSSGTPQFKRRDSVQHAKFGVGTVIESNLTRDDEEVTVAFPGVGIKKLLASMAGLKKL